MLPRFYFFIFWCSFYSTLISVASWSACSLQNYRSSWGTVLMHSIALYCCTSTCGWYIQLRALRSGHFIFFGAEPNDTIRAAQIRFWSLSPALCEVRFWPSARSPRTVLWIKVVLFGLNGFRWHKKQIRFSEIAAGRQKLQKKPKKQAKEKQEKKSSGLAIRDKQKRKRERERESERRFVLTPALP